MYGKWYAVEIENSAAQFNGCTATTSGASDAAALADELRPRGCEKMSGFDTTYRIRLGNYRVVYIVDFTQRVITVTRVGQSKAY